MIFGGGRRDDREEGGGALGLLVTMIVAPLAAMLIQMAISRSREFQADDTGARLVRDPEALASALRKIAGGAAQSAARREPADARICSSSTRCARRCFRTSSVPTRRSSNVSNGSSRSPSSSGHAAR